MAVPRYSFVSAARGRGLQYAGALAAATTLALATACGSGGDGDGGGGGTDIPKAPKVKADAKLAEKVPKDIRDKGTIKIGVDSTYAPGEFLDEDGKTVVGYNVQLFDAVAAKLDLKTQWESSTFGTIVEGVDTGKYDVGVSSFTINSERLKQANMVSYYNVGTQWFTAKGNPEKLDPEDACGMKVAVQKDTVQVPDIQARSDKCEKDGKKKITVNQYKGQDEATQSITSGKNDGGLADMPVAVYAVEQTNGKLETLGKQYEAAPYGAVVNKDDDDMTEAVRAGYQGVMDDGTYSKILGNWDLDKQGTIDEAEINPKVEENSGADE